MEKKLIKEKYYTIIKIISLLYLINPIITQNCERELPILKDGNCVLDYCTKQEFKDKVCVIDNQIVKTQWLNDIIWIGNQNFIYINFANNSNGDMIVETTSYPSSEKRIFYGINRDGNPFFKDNNFFSSINVTEQEGNPDKGRYEGEIFFAKSTIDNKEYLVSIGKNYQYVEVYNFNDSQVLYQISSISLFGRMVIGLRGAVINFELNEDGIYNNYIIYGFISNSNFCLKKMQLSLNNILIKSEFLSENNIVGNSVSCFMTESLNIICFYLLKVLALNHYKIIALDQNFEEQKKLALDYTIPSDYSYFFKCIHLKENIGVFILYRYLTILNPENKNPIILIKDYDSEFKKFNNYLSFNRIILDEIEFNNNDLLNDLIKISDEKICFISTSDDKDKLYIVLIKILDTDKIVIRYYSIEIYLLNNYKFFLQMRQHLYNNYISFAFSFCINNLCSDDSDEHYSGLIIFSYANGTDYNLDLTNYLFNNNDIKIYNFVINLKKNVTIDNNVFGLIYKGIRIKNILNCHNIDFVSSINENKDINTNYILEKNEDIKLKFPNNIINKVNCTISYQYIITEPDFSEYNKYTIERQIYGDDEESTIFDSQKSEYESKILNYNIIISENLKRQCSNENCELCLQNQNYCITCKFKYLQRRKFKNCLSEEKSDIQETKLSEIISNSIIETETTEIKTNLPTTVLTEKQTDSINEIEVTEIKTNLPTTVLTEKKTDPIKEIETTELEVVITEKEKFTQKIEESKKNCTIDQILNNECSDGTVKNEQTGELYSHFKGEILENFNGETKLIQTENVIMEISTLDNQKDSLNPNVSTIDLGECENILRTEYHIPKNESLIVIKIDIKNEDLTATYVQYEVLHPKNKTKLDLNLCGKVKITVNTPVKLSTETVSLYNSLGESGYNLFDSEDDFYNDICATYTSENGTDMTLEDRKKEIYSSSGNITMCQSGCTFELYNETTKKAKCNCDAQNKLTETDISKINFDKDSIGENFLNTLKNSNFLVLKCYKLVLNLKNIFKNKGRIVMTLIFILFLVSLFIYIIKDRKQLIIYINLILRNKLNYEEYEINSENGNLNINNKNKNKNRRNSQFSKVVKNKNNNNMKKNKKEDDNKKNQKQKKENKKKPEKNNKKNNNKNNKKKSIEKHEPSKRKNNKVAKKDNSKVNSRRSMLSTSSNRLSNQINKLGGKININIIPINNVNYGKVVKKNANKNKIEKDVKIFRAPTEKNDKNNKKNKGKIVNKLYNSLYKQNLNDQELNTLEYEIAIIIDKRTYFQYYWSLLKKKQLILFTFLPAKDYNLFSLKIALFLLSFSLYFTINGFFFSDETMHKIHEDNGAFNIIYQIPQILYSSIISAIINMILKLLSLSEKDILSLKQEKDLKKATKYSKAIQRYIIIKFVIFFILSNILLLFFWYFISCFCAVYNNTQMILIKDTLVSFGLSMIYPFGLNIIPGLFRMPALRAKNKDKKCLYKISTIIALI